MPAPSPQSPALPGESHAAYSRRTIGENPSSPCTAHTMTFGGRCLRCGWGPASPHPTPAPLDLAQFDGFTPGPWSCLTSGGSEVWNRYDVRHFSHQVHSRIAYARDADLHDMHDGNAKANARLIAAAPALLEECRRQREELRWLADSEAALIRRRTEQDAELTRQRAEIERLRGALIGLRNRADEDCWCFTVWMGEKLHHDQCCIKARDALQQTGEGA